MDYETICFIVGDLYLRSQQQIESVKADANKLVETIQEQLAEKDRVIQSLESEFQRIRKEKNEK